MRPSKRAADEMRSVSFERGVARYAEGSCIVRFGDTHVLCAASLEDKPPPWLRGQGRGWVTAEYAMLPRATLTRTKRKSATGKVSGRSHEIQRLIGRSLRSVVDLPRLGERQITIDCDVLQADGGTRTAAITGAWVALRDCLQWMASRSILRDSPLKDHVAAVSCGVVGGEAVIDLDYAEELERPYRREFRHDRGRRSGRGAGLGGRRAVQRGRTHPHAGAGAQRHRPARGVAEGGDRIAVLRPARGEKVEDVKDRRARKRPWPRIPRGRGAPDRADRRMRRGRAPPGPRARAWRSASRAARADAERRTPRRRAGPR